MSHQDFWRRYFYKVHQLELDEARKQALMKRAERANVKEDSICWDDGREHLCVCVVILFSEFTIVAKLEHWTLNMQLKNWF